MEARLITCRALTWAGSVWGRWCRKLGAHSVSWGSGDFPSFPFPGLLVVVWSAVCSDTHSQQPLPLYAFQEVLCCLSYKMRLFPITGGVVFWLTPHAILLCSVPVSGQRWLFFLFTSHPKRSSVPKTWSRSYSSYSADSARTKMLSK